MLTSLIRIENLQRHFKMGEETVRALDGVSTTIEAGESLAIMGPSGSGKSTLLHLLGGLDRPTGGRFWVNGIEISTLDESVLATYRRREIGFIFQSFHLIPTMTALQNVAFPMIFSGVSARERCALASDLLARVGLADRMHHKPTELSGGQQQRIAVARALVNNPSIILADEPTGNLDSQTGGEIMELLAQLNREERRTILIVSHDPAVTDYAARAIHLLDGRLLVPHDHQSGVGYYEQALHDQSVPCHRDSAERSLGGVRLGSTT
jgi:putative ABC transport system ATP-binding protein